MRVLPQLRIFGIDAQQHLTAVAVCSGLLAVAAAAFPQARVHPQQSSPAAPNADVQPVVDPLGRSTPRGTVLGFLMAGRKGDDDRAAMYLDARQSPKAAAALAAQLFVVLDRRLPAHLNELSDRPEGSPADLVTPTRYLVGTIPGNDVGIYLERVEDKAGLIWLFSKDTLQQVPNLYEETRAVSFESVLPRWLVEIKVGEVSLYQWLAFLVGLPFIYFFTFLLNRLFSLLLRFLVRQVSPAASVKDVQFIPHPLRLLFVALVIRWLLTALGLSLMARQFWSSTATIITIAASIWIAVALNGRSQRYIRGKLQSRNLTGAASVQQLIRRCIDILIVMVGLFFALHHFGVNASTALAGLGIGGIAIALAAQKTLENIIGGISLIADKAARIGDMVRIGGFIGTVEDISLRSLKIRTLDRGIAIIPNGQVANMNLEVLSARDKFQFHLVVPLHHSTTISVLEIVETSIRQLLELDSHVEQKSLRVRFFRLGFCSFDIEIFGYVYAGSWMSFLELQEKLLCGIVEIVQSAGVQFGFPAVCFESEAALSSTLARRLVGTSSSDPSPSELGRNRSL